MSPVRVVCQTCTWRGGEIALETRHDHGDLSEKICPACGRKPCTLESTQGRYVPKTIPFAHQKEDLAASWSMTTFALFHEMGCGKTKIILDTTAMLWEQGQIEALAVVAPKGVYLNWISEIEAHLPDRIDRSVGAWSSKKTKQQADRMAQLLEPCGEALTVFLINVEALATPRGIAQLKAFLHRYESILVIDESTAIKNPSAKRTQAVMNLAPLARYRRILTGTPITQSPLDLYAPCAVLDRDLMGFPSYHAFKARYAETVRIDYGKGPVSVVKGFRRLDELSEKVARFSSRRLKIDCLDLPPKIYETREVELSAEQRKAYDQMRSEARVELDTGERLSAPDVLSKLLRLHQISCGFVKIGDHETDLKNGRIDALHDAIDEAPGKVIVWAGYRRNIATVTDALGARYGASSVVTYFGDTSTEDRLTAVDRFQNDPECRFFVGNPQTAGYGLTLTAADTVVYFSNSYRLEVRLQSEDRAHRIGQHRPVVYIDLIAPGTVDERIVRCLKAKKSVADEVMGESWREWI